MISPRLSNSTGAQHGPMNTYRVNFYLNGYRVIRNPVMIESDCSENAEAVVRVLLDTAHKGIPERFDDWCLIRC